MLNVQFPGVESDLVRTWPGLC